MCHFPSQNRNKQFGVKPIFLFKFSLIFKKSAVVNHKCSSATVKWSGLAFSLASKASKEVATFFSHLCLVDELMFELMFERSQGRRVIDFTCLLSVSILLQPNRPQPKASWETAFTQAWPQLSSFFTPWLDEKVQYFFFSFAGGFRGLRR